MSKERDQMIRELKKWVVPELRNEGFTGDFPHYRRLSGERLDLFTFQFNRYGGSFLMEISYVYPNLKGKARNLIFDKEILPEKIVTADTGMRTRLRSRKYRGEWFYYHDIIEVKRGFFKFTIQIPPVMKEEILTINKGKIKRWIQIADDSIYETVAKEALNYLPEAEVWWRQRSKK